MIDKIDKQTGKEIENVEFTIVKLDKDSGKEIGEKITAKTNEEGKLAIKINGVKAKGEYVYKITETKLNGYKQIKEIKIKVYIGEEGNVQKIELLEENEAIKEIKVEEQIIRLIIENEKEKRPENNNTINNTTNNTTNTTPGPDDNNNKIENNNGISGANNNTNKENKTIGSAIKNAVSKIPYTGASYVIILLLISSSAIAAISYIRYKNIK